MIEMNKDLPYEQQMKPILEKYDKLVEENRVLREKAEELKQFKALVKTTGELRNFIRVKEHQSALIKEVVKDINKFLIKNGWCSHTYSTLNSSIKVLFNQIKTYRYETECN